LPCRICWKFRKAMKQKASSLLCACGVKINLYFYSLESF
jgi:hypothetical protein